MSLPAIRIRVLPTAPRLRVRAMPSIQPQQIALQNTGEAVQWRLGVGAWQDLIGIDEISASVAVGSVTTLAAGSPASVANVGTEQVVVLDFGIPAGADGSDGADGEDGLVLSVVAGDGVTVDATDPANPEVAVTFGSSAGTAAEGNDSRFHDAVTLAGGLDYLTLSGQQITRGPIDLATDVSGDLPLANLAQGAALSVLGVAGNGTADNASIAAGSDHQVLRRSGTAIGFGAVALDQANAVTGTLPGGSVAAATDAERGTVELATTAEALTGTDTDRAVTPAGLAAATIMQGVHEIWIDAAMMAPDPTAPAEAVAYDSGGNDVAMFGYGFDTTTQEYVHFKWRMPKSWNEGTITFIPVWTNAGGLTTENVVWSLAGVGIGNDDTLNATMGTAQTSNDTWLAQNDMHEGPESSAITIGGTPQQGDLVAFELSRVVGSDNLTGDAVLLGVILRMSFNAATDA